MASLQHVGRSFSVFRVALVMSALAIAAATGTTSAEQAAGASTEPPPQIVRPPHGARLIVGRSHTFASVVAYSVTALWEVSPNGGSTWSTSEGDNRTLKDGDLKSSYTFGLFTAPENGWEVRVGFVNDPCGAPLHPDHGQ